MAIGNPPPAAFSGNNWTELEAPPLGEWTPTATVSVILPYFESPDALALTLAALSSQTYPKELTELIVADDGSDPPASIPDDFAHLSAKVVTQENRGFGLARARNTGAAAAAGEILVFLDSDMVAEPRWLEAHARWHHLVADALTLGFRRHVDFEGVTASDVRTASATDDLEGLLAGRRQEQPDWIEYHMTRLASLTSSDDDLFRIVTGGNLGVRRETFEEAGRFDESFEQWGLEDTEFAYRAFTLGDVLIPERAAACWHQGLGTLPDRAEKVSQAEQRARASHLIAEKSFRRSRPGRSYLVPMVVVEVAAGNAPGEQVGALVEQVLAGSYHDLVVALVVGNDHPQGESLRRQFGPDPRVVADDQTDPDTGFRFSPVRMEIPPEVAISSRTVGTLLDRLDGVGLVEIPISEGVVVRAVKTRALRRAGKLGDEPWEGARRLYGSRQLRPGEAGIRRGSVSHRLVPADSKAGKVAYRFSQIRSPRDFRLFVRWLSGALRWRVQTRLGTSRFTTSEKRASRGPTPEPRPSLSVAAIEDAGRNWLPDVVELQPEWSGDLSAHVGDRLDVLLVDPAAENSLETKRLMAAAGELGAIPVTGETIYPTVPSVDTTVFSPIGFRSRTDIRFAMLAPGLGRLPTAEPAVDVDVFGASGEVALPTGWQGKDYPPSAPALLEELREYRGVLDDQALHATADAQASSILSLGAAGIPIVSQELPVDVRALIGQRVSAVLKAITIDSLSDSHVRERLSVDLRRAVLVEHSTSSRLAVLVRKAGIPSVSVPTVSVLLATNRPAQLEHAVAQLGKQTHPSLQVVLALHGFDDAGAAETIISTRLPEVEVVGVDAGLTFGDAFNAATLVASGNLIAKMDDDDWYDADHITDLVLALEYTGAELVAKGAEFVYLSDSDTTIRRFVGGAESYSTTIGGGAMLMKRSDLIDLGGWPRVRRHIDRELISLIESRGGRVYRTHGFGYVLHRHRRGHTWEANDDYFTAQADDRRPGLDLTWAGVGG